jgi:transcriptional regulator with XRE-family HTH domain
MGKANQESPESIREKLRDAAAASGLTLEEIGSRMGFKKGGARQAVSRLLNQKDYDPRLSSLVVFAHAIGKNLAEII